MEVVSHILINAPVDAVFLYYSNQNRLQEWVPGGGILEFTPLTPAPKKVGSRYRMAYKSFGVTFRLVAELTALDTNHKSAMDQVTGDYRSFHYEMLFIPADSLHTQIEMRINAKLPWGVLGLIADWLSRPFVKRDISNAVARLKTGVESLAGLQLSGRVANNS